ncbi:MAG TPA: hypothetical protein VMX57_09325, partial [Planctomycetota bacterium]|nr:hypothetical protein [Planctomycetota bacterium]
VKDAPDFKVEPTKLYFAFANARVKPVKLNTYALTSWCVSLDVKGPDANSVRVIPMPPTTRTMMATPVEADFPVLKPGETWPSRAGSPFPGWFGRKRLELCKRGVYRVRAVYTGAKGGPGGALAEGSAIGTVTSNELVFRVGHVSADAGRPVDGLKLTLTVDRTEFTMTPRQLRRATADTPRYNVEPVKLKLAFTNVGDKPIKLNAYQLAQWRLTLNATALGAGDVRSKPIPAIPAAIPAMRQHELVTIEPGRSWTVPGEFPFPGTFGGTDYTLFNTGEYCLSVTYACLTVDDGHSFAEGSWLGSVVSNEVVVRGVQPGQAVAQTTAVAADVGGEVVAAEPADTDGKPVNGLKLILTADATELTMTPRELLRAHEDSPRWNVAPTKLHLTFTNVSDQPLKLSTYDLPWTLATLAVRGPDDESVRTRDVRALIKRRMMLPRPADFPVLNPGESWTHPWDWPFPAMTFGVEHILMKPGEYRLRITYVCTEFHRKLRGGADCWTGTVISNELVLKAVAKP